MSKIRYSYTVYGVLFGLFFPIVGSVFNAWTEYQTLDISVMIQMQKDNHLLWIIDLAPLVLGILFYRLGVRRDTINRQMNVLQKAYNLLERKNEKIQEEIALAVSVSQHFLPEIQPHPLLDFSYRMKSKGSLGGDVLSVFDKNEDSFSFFLGDVSGYGISAFL